MSTATLSDTDVRVRNAVLRQLEWDPDVDVSGIGVAAHAGTVTLTGYVASFGGKVAAERAAKRVRGVRSVANDIVVRLVSDRNDSDIASDVTKALELRQTVPDTVQATVRNGEVTLTGTATWLRQKQEAEEAVRHIRGVRNVVDEITVAPRALLKDVRHRIVQTLHHTATVDASHITVTIDGDTAILAGSVSTWLQRESAERAAGDAPGIARVDNRIVVEPPAPPPDVDEIC